MIGAIKNMDSFFEIKLEDGSYMSEKETKLSSISEIKKVKFLGKEKTVSACKFKLKSIKCFHEGMEAEIEIPYGCQAYQAIRSEAVIIKDIQRKDRILGRIIGVIKNDEVIEEKFINGIELKVQGFKK